MNELASETVIVEAPMSYVGALRRIGRYRRGHSPAVEALIVLGIVPWFLAITAWYSTFGLLVVPYRLVRRSQRKRKRDELRHRELLGVALDGVASGERLGIARTSAGAGGVTEVDLQDGSEM